MTPFNYSELTTKDQLNRNWNPEVSVIIPSMDEEETIGRCIEKIKKVFGNEHISGEIIVADNSSDRTPEIANELGAKVVKPEKLGYGYAYLYGFKHASGRYIVMGDADDTYDFLEMPKLLRPLQDGESDLVIGSRFKGEIKEGAMPWLHKYIGNPVLTGFLNLFFKTRVSDAHSGFRACTREALERMKLRSSGMEFASEMIIEAVRKKLRIKEVAINYYKREGESKISSFADGWRHLKFMLLYAPNYLYFIPGAILLLWGIWTLLISYFNVSIGYYPHGIHAMIAGSLLTIVGYQIIFLGIFTKIYGLHNDLLNPDGITKFITGHVSLERGATFGLILFGLGLLHTLHLIWEWASSGYKVLPVEGQNMIGFTLLVIGLQTIFYSFFLSVIGGEKSR